MTRPALLHVVPVQPELPPEPLVTGLVSALGERLGVPVQLNPPLPFDPAWLTAERSQLSSDSVVDALIARYPWEDEKRRDEWVLGLTAADIVAAGGGAVFGEATVGGRWCLVSSARLGAPGMAACAQRTLQECLHELGHLSGLSHCADPGCLMHPARGVEDIDLRRDVLCTRCRSRTAGDSVLDPDFSSR